MSTKRRMLEHRERTVLAGDGTSWPVGPTPSQLRQYKAGQGAWRKKPGDAPGIEVKGDADGTWIEG